MHVWKNADNNLMNSSPTHVGRHTVYTDLFSTSLSRGRLPLLAAPLMASIVSDHTTTGWDGHQCGMVGEKRDIWRERGEGRRRE